MSFIRFDEQTEPATPPAGKATLYVDSADSEVAVKKDDGSVQKFLVSVSSVFGRTGAIVAQASDYDANQIDYDNTTSGLTATDVQAAIDEIVANPTVVRETLPDQAITNAGAVTVPHSLGAGAFVAGIQLVCIAAESDWVIGDILDMTFKIDDRVTLQTTATDVIISYDDRNEVFRVHEPSSNANVNLSNTNWNFRVTLMK